MEFKLPPYGFFLKHWCNWLSLNSIVYAPRCKVVEDIPEIFRVFTHVFGWGYSFAGVLAFQHEVGNGGAGVARCSGHRQGTRFPVCPVEKIIYAVFGGSTFFTGNANAHHSKFFLSRLQRPSREQESGGEINRPDADTVYFNRVAGEKTRLPQHAEVFDASRIPQSLLDLIGNVRHGSDERTEPV